MLITRRTAVLAPLGLLAARRLPAQAPPAADGLAAAATAFLQALSPELRAKAGRPFDAPDRKQWHYTPFQDKNKKPLHKGVHLDELDPAQRQAALAVARAGLSRTGFEQAERVRVLEGMLADLEGGRAAARVPGWYFSSVFGTPGRGKWGWRFEGHHISVNLTLDGDKVLAASPVMFGANPAEVRTGPEKGVRTLADVVDPAQKLMAMLTDAQLKQARQPESFPDVAEDTPALEAGEPVGLRAGDMTEEQRALVWQLLAAYCNRLSPAVAALELKRVQEADIKAVRFAFSRHDGKPGRPYTFRLHSPAAVAEFLNEQRDGSGNPANHIHTCWRRLPQDFA